MLGDPLHTLSFREIELLSALGAHQSLRGIARTHGMSPAAISRGVTGIERRLGTQILQRGAQGVCLTDRGRKMVVVADELLRSMRRLLEAARSPEGEVFVSYLGVGFSPGLCSLLAGILAAAIEGISPGTGCRMHELAGDGGAEGARVGSLDLIVAFDGVDPGRQWTCSRIGSCPWILCARSGHAVFRGAGAEASVFPLVQLPHSHWPASGAGLEAFHELLAGFPLGSEVPDARSALAVAAATDELACVPEIFARAGLAAGDLRVVRQAPLFTSALGLHANADHVPSKVFRAVAEALGKALAVVGPAASPPIKAGRSSEFQPGHLG